MSDPTDPSPHPDQIELARGVYIAWDALRIQFTRSSGPGGQNVNKLNTRSELWISVDDIVGMTPGGINRLKRLAGKRLTKEGRIHLVAQTERSQERNRAAVMDRLRQMVETAIVEPKPRRATKPSRAAKRRRLDSKRRRGEIKSNRSDKGDW